MASINFFSEDISFSLKNKNAVRKWLKSIILSEQHSLFELNYIFCSDVYLLKLNIEYLNHNYFTDVITFNNSSTPSIIEGDVFISVDRVKENALELDQNFSIELNRVMAHGLLHLLGFNDSTENEIVTIRFKENFYLSHINF